jgi:hypothetical protein
MRLKCWTINCAVFLIGFAWVGPTGLRCLFGAKEFKYDEYCNYQTGVREYQTRKTVIGTFKTVTYGIKRSRDYFESLPDRGLFGKKFSRYFNYLECYVFRLILCWDNRCTHSLSDNYYCLISTLCVTNRNCVDLGSSYNGSVLYL